MRKRIHEVLRESVTAKRPVGYFIDQLKKEWLEKYGIEACDINKSECVNFAEALAEVLSEAGYADVEILTTDLFFDTATELAKEDEGEILYDPSDYGSVKPENFQWTKNGYHGWIYVDGKHYDSDTSNGVENFYDLPIFVAKRKQ